ncbi:MAG: flavohemoprotein [Alteromonadaceae bacterium]|nr:MAG: flavohemoprotein [Alteromonadaceae bacterium]
MISKESLPYIKASVPVLREHGLTITTLFYKNMFAAHPELKHLFSRSSQAGGAQQQALAGAVYAYADNIEKPEFLSSVLNRIAHKHASLGIKPAQYTIVGKYLLGAIAQTLGDGATPELLDAWDEAYWLLAGELIAMEARLYHEKDISPSTSWRNLTIADIRRESEHVLSFYLTAPEGESVGDFIPGQYLSIALTFKELELQQIRQYSLSDAPGKDSLRISVKSEIGDDLKGLPDGLVSNGMHALKIGDSVMASQAYGDFVLPEKVQNPVVLISAGIGITPFISMLNTLKASATKHAVRFLHGARQPDAIGFSQELSQARNEMEDYKDYFFFNKNDGSGSNDNNDTYHAEHGNVFSGQMHLQKVPEVVDPKASFYLCGPLQFMRVIRRQLLDFDIPAENIHYEVFGPDLFRT